MAAIYFPPGFKALGRIPTLLSNFPECAMDTKPPEPNYLPDPRIIVEKLLYDNLDHFRLPWYMSRPSRD